MTPDDLRRVFSELKTWKRRGERAPHKPLLLLYALGRVARKEPRLNSYEDTKEKLKQLLIEFGPPRVPKATYPFIRLQNDGIWEIKGRKSLDPRVDWGDKILLENNTMGGFTQEVYEKLSKDGQLIRELANIILEQNFPDSIHKDILDLVGLDIEISKPRDSEFREKILRAYEYSCAVCGFNVRLGHTLVAVEAAHIKWHQAGGPDIEKNGIALCTMHHKLYDRGVFTINKHLEFCVSEMAHGSQGFQEWLMKFHGKKVRKPQKVQYKPADEYINWHVREVFKGPCRYSVNTLDR